ncbi:hypothetical protein IVB16_32305 [Bradyrhizobium sp. 183]|uniref:aldolase/citrate lyase family protein n=1 Tax=unclassified Bradyrhizobium TaxID=2631580 RepID=UPI001FFF6421|nr:MULTISPECIES: aldolase/citrate lyase family protein [unclassified Bradyrhizobium]UPJ79373.1 hypothetical protein IVB17_32305 [Bradyrhizobium sp. 184]UPJ87167.1 hypothetical protein IVB16_32305 [Bradyrhizobium sp. 183]
MPQTFREARWYRSMLYVPGSKLDWMLKAPKYGAAALIFDLEDAVELTQKPMARKSVAIGITELRASPIGRFVRLNGWRTGFLLDDLNSIVIDGLDGVALAKAEDPKDIAALDRVLGELERSRGLPVGRIEICPHAEAAVARYKFYALCMASQRVKRGAVPAWLRAETWLVPWAYGSKMTPTRATTFGPTPFCKLAPLASGMSKEAWQYVVVREQGSKRLSRSQFFSCGGI